jgi:hypothetical protein
LVSRFWDICSNFTPTPEENDQYSANQYKHQYNQLLSINNYTPLVISRDDKNKQPTRVGKNPGFFKKNPAQWGFLFFLGFFLGFFAQTRGFLGFFLVSRILLGASRP